MKYRLLNDFLGLKKGTIFIPSKHGDYYYPEGMEASQIIGYIVNSDTVENSPYVFEAFGG